MPSSGGGNNDDGDSGDSNNNRNNGGGGDGGDGSESNGDYRGEALFVLTQVGRKLGSLPADLSASVEGGRVTGEIVRRFCRDGGVAAAPLAAAVLLSFLSDTTRVMTIVADFMLVYLPAPTVSLQPPLATSAGLIANFFHNCPDNAFQIAMAGRSYSLLQRLGAILRNGAKLFAVGTSASLVVVDHQERHWMASSASEDYCSTSPRAFHTFVGRLTAALLLLVTTRAAGYSYSGASVDQQ